MIPHFQCTSEAVYTIRYAYGSENTSADITGCTDCGIVHESVDFSSVSSDVRVSISVAGLTVERIVCKLKCCLHTCACLILAMDT